MQLRILTEPQFGGTYNDILMLARAAEAAGLDGFFRSDHYLNRTDPQSPSGLTDAWTTLAGLARDTARVNLGVLITAATLRHPAVLAISVAQIDQMSGGRVEFSLGSGHDSEEHERYGIPFPEVAHRFDLMTEQLEIITGLWKTASGQSFNFVGDHYRLVDAPLLSASDQRPIPVIIGGYGKRRTPELAARFAGEFNIIFADPATAATQFRRVDAAARAIKRDPREIIRSAALAVAVARDDAARTRRLNAIRRYMPWLIGHEGVPPDHVLHGSPENVVDKICRYREATGIERLYLNMPDLRDVEHVELIASAVQPKL